MVDDVGIIRVLVCRYTDQAAEAFVDGRQGVGELTVEPFFFDRFVGAGQQVANSCILVEMVEFHVDGTFQPRQFEIAKVRIVKKV